MECKYKYHYRETNTRLQDDLFLFWKSEDVDYSLHFQSFDHFLSLFKEENHMENKLFLDLFAKVFPHQPYCNEGRRYRGNDNQGGRVLDLLFVSDHHGSHKVGHVYTNQGYIHSLQTKNQWITIVNIHYCK